jgi:hypothetical protein
MSWVITAPVTNEIDSLEATGSSYLNDSLSDLVGNASSKHHAGDKRGTHTALFAPF